GERAPAKWIEKVDRKTAHIRRRTERSGHVWNATDDRALIRAVVAVINIECALVEELPDRTGHRRRLDEVAERAARQKRENLDHGSFKGLRGAQLRGSRRTLPRMAADRQSSRSYLRAIHRTASRLRPRI